MAQSETQTASIPPRSVETIAQLYDLHAASVERWVARLGGPRVDVPDLVHDVFVIAYRRYPFFRGEASVATWLFRITLRVVRRRRQREALRRWTSLGPELETTLAAERPDPLAEAERQEQVTRLYAALDRLPERYRTPVILYELEGIEGEEIARLLDIELSTVWVRLHRARAKLSKRLAGARGGRP